MCNLSRIIPLKRSLILYYCGQLISFPVVCYRLFNLHSQKSTGRQNFRDEFCSTLRLPVLCMSEQMEIDSS